LVRVAARGARSGSFARRFAGTPQSLGLRLATPGRRPRLRTDQEVTRRPAVRARGAGDRRPRQHRSLAPARNRDPWSRQRDPDAASADSHPSRADRLLGIDARGRLSPRSRIAHRSKKKPPGASTPAARQPGRTDRHPAGRSACGNGGGTLGKARRGRQAGPSSCAPKAPAARPLTVRLTALQRTVSKPCASLRGPSGASGRQSGWPGRFLRRARGARWSSRRPTRDDAAAAAEGAR